MTTWTEGTMAVPRWAAVIGDFRVTIIKFDEFFIHWRWLPGDDRCQGILGNRRYQALEDAKEAIEKWCAK